MNDATTNAILQIQIVGVLSLILYISLMRYLAEAA